MNATVYFDFPAHWTARDLADAVPLRLSALLDFYAARVTPPASANAAAPQTTARPWRHGYMRPPALPAAFRIH